ncbi:MAG: hypothetical protein K0S99_3828, partial [Thermomicrobiales bacterium]|nr:hypothetical protein [Thermomicrobiales bacterium]
AYATSLDQIDEALERIEGFLGCITPTADRVRANEETVATGILIS